MTGDTDRDDVLESFALEAEGDATALARYLRDYPQYAVALVDLSHEMTQSMPDEAATPSPRDEAQIASAWTRFAALVPTTMGAAQGKPASVFDGRSAAEMKALAVTLDVPRQVIAAVRDRRVLVDSIPKGFLARMAAGIDARLEDLMASIGGIRSATLAPSYKADMEKCPLRRSPRSLARPMI